jgi:hypothetical protein
MKKIILLLSVITLFSCSKEGVETLNEENIATNDTSSRRLDPTEGVTGGGCVDLIAGQNIVVGTVCVDLIGDQIEVTYTTTGDWELDLTHLYVGDCEARPANNPGNPLIGQFPYSEAHANGTTTFTYSVDEAVAGCFGCVAAHAEVSNSTGQHETAWGNGDPYGGNSWAMYFPYDLCPE